MPFHGCEMRGSFASVVDDFINGTFHPLLHAIRNFVNLAVENGTYILLGNAKLFCKFALCNPSEMQLTDNISHPFFHILCSPPLFFIYYVVEKLKVVCYHNRVTNLRKQHRSNGVGVSFKFFNLEHNISLEFLKVNRFFLNFLNLLNMLKTELIFVEFYEWFVKMCAKNDESPSAVANAVGVSAAAANGWKKGSIPKSVVMMKIEEHFGEKFEAEDTLQTLKDEEKALLHSYRTMTEEQKRMMLVFAKGLKND